MGKLTKEEFFNRVENKFGDWFDLSKAKEEFVDRFSVITVKCNRCGHEFKIIAKNLLIKSKGCSNCLGTLKHVYTKEIILSLLNKKFGDRISFSFNGEYNSLKDKIDAVCNQCGTKFSVSVDWILNHNGDCPSCGKNVHKLDFNTYFKRLEEKFGDTFDFSVAKTEFIDTNSKLTVKCNSCGNTFVVDANQLLHKTQKCPLCKTKTHKLTNEEYVSRLKEKFGDRFDYSKVNYVNSRSEVTLICNNCGTEFHKRAGWILNQKNPCPGCDYKNSNLNKIKFLDRVKNKFGDKLSFTEIDYKNAKCSIKVHCNECGHDFDTAPDLLIETKFGCPNCAITNRRKTVEEFIEISREKHGNKYEYDRVKDLPDGLETYVEIYCNQCKNYFRQKAKMHINGCGCQACASHMSSYEFDIIDFVKERYNGEIVHCDRSVLKPKEIDVYFPDHRVGVEVTGNYWHSTYVKNDRQHLFQKFKESDSKGVKLYTFYEDELLNRKDICLSMILGSLGVYDKVVYARKTKVKEVSDRNLVSDFLDKNHLQGKIPSYYKAYGLYVDDELLSLMTFTKPRQNMGRCDDGKQIELSRFCTLLNTRVVGGASRLLKHFIRENPEFKYIYSYSNNRYSNGKLYNSLGFTYKGDVDIDYFYVNLNVDNCLKRVNKRYFRKSAVKARGIDIENKTEYELAKNEGFERLYDCGKKLWELRIL